MDRCLRQAVACFIVVAATTTAARAEFKLHYPIVEYREREFENASGVSFDKSNSGLNNGQSYVNEIEYGLFPWWEPGIELELAADPGENLRYDATSCADADSFTFGPLVQKEQILGSLDLLHTANLLFSKEVGRNRSDETPVSIAWQTRLRLHPMFEPGIEYYGDFLPIEGRDATGEPQHRLGPGLFGLVNFYQYGKLRYEVGYLFGLNRATERGVVRWRLEFEKSF